MGNVWVLFKNNLKVSILKKPVAFLLMLFAPLLILFGSMKLLMNGGGLINVAVFDYDNSTTSKEIVQVLEDNDVIKIMNIDEEQIDSSFASNNIEGVVKINEGYEDSLLKSDNIKIDLLTRENDSLNNLLKSIIGEKINNLKKFVAIAEGSKEQYNELIEDYNNNKIVEIKEKSLADLSKDYSISQIFVGFVIFFMLLRGANSAARYYDEKYENIYSRIFTTPTKTWQYYLADILSNYVVILIQALFAVAFIKILNVNMGIGYLSLFIILSIIGLFSVVLAVCVRAFSKDSSVFSIAFNFLSMIIIMLGGGFVPLDLLPDTMNKIAYFNPVRWTIDAMSSMQQGAQTKVVAFKLLIVGLFIIALFVVAIYKTTKDEKNFE